jgi:hypothetical protein
MIKLMAHVKIDGCSVAYCSAPYFPPDATSEHQHGRSRSSSEFQCVVLETVSNLIHVQCRNADVQSKVRVQLLSVYSPTYESFFDDMQHNRWPPRSTKKDSEQCSDPPTARQSTAQCWGPVLAFLCAVAERFSHLAGALIGNANLNMSSSVSSCPD